MMKSVSDQRKKRDSSYRFFQIKRYLKKEREFGNVFSVEKEETTQEQQSPKNASKRNSKG